jgi:twinkle protein
MITVRDYLIQKGIQFKMRGDEAVSNCPFCPDKDRKFSVNVKSGAYRCFHENSCGVSGSFVDLQKRFGDQPKRLNEKSPFISSKKPKNYAKPKTVIAPVSSPVMEYLEKTRSFTKETISYFKIGAKGEDTVEIPFYKDGILVNVKYRSIKEKSKMWQEKEAEPVLFNRDNIMGDRLIICEGEYDCMALHQYGISGAVSVPSGAGNFDWVENEWDYLDTFSQVILCFDNDNAGNTKSRELVAKIGSWKCKGAILPHKDANECLMKGVLKEKIVECIDFAKDYAPAILSKPSDFAEEIKETFRNPDKLNGTKTAWPKLTKVLGGWRSEELTVWTGRSGAGKSTILNQVVLQLAGEGINSCIASLEMPAKSYLRWAIVQYQGNWNPSDSGIDSALKFMDDKLYIVNTHEEIKESDLFDVFEYAARRHNCRHMIIDSLVRVVLEEKEELEAQKAFVSKLVSFCKKFSCHVHLVAHPRKGMKDSDRPDKSDVKGNSAITDLAHNVISLWRPEDDGSNEDPHGDVLMQVLKNREIGTTGKIRMKFDKGTKRFTDGG